MSTANSESIKPINDGQRDADGSVSGAVSGTHGIKSAIAIGNNGTETITKRPRGRPPTRDPLTGEKLKPTGERPTAQRPTSHPSNARAAVNGNKLALKALAPTLQFMHAAAADVLKMPELSIEKSEAETLANAAEGIFALYDMQVSPAVAAWLTFAGAAATVYAPRVVMIRTRLQQERAFKDAEATNSLNA
jgi:hypothetical protein